MNLGFVLPGVESLFNRVFGEILREKQTEGDKERLGEREKEKRQRERKRERVGENTRRGAQPPSLMRTSRGRLGEQRCMGAGHGETERVEQQGARNN